MRLKQPVLTYILTAAALNLGALEAVEFNVRTDERRIADCRGATGILCGGH